MRAPVAAVGALVAACIVAAAALVERLEDAASVLCERVRHPFSAMHLQANKFIIARRAAVLTDEVAEAHGARRWCGRGGEPSACAGEIGARERSALGVGGAGRASMAHSFTSDKTVLRKQGPNGAGSVSYAST